MRSLPAPGPLQNANSPVTTGTTPRRGTLRPTGPPRGLGRRTSALTCLAPATGRCPVGVGGRPGGARGLGFRPPAFLWVLSPIPPMRLNQASSGPREIRMWGQGSQRSRLSGLRVGTGGLFHGLRPDGSILASLPGATASEPATPTAPGSCLPSSPHLPHPLGPAPALPDRDCQPLGSCPLGLALRGQGGRVGVGAPPRPTPPAPTHLSFTGPPRGSPFGGRWESPQGLHCSSPADSEEKRREQSISWL